MRPCDGLIWLANAGPRGPRAAREVLPRGAGRPPAPEAIRRELAPFGLEEDPLGDLERAVGFVDTTGRKHGIEHPVQMTVGLSNGERLWAVRYSTQHDSRTLFVSEHADVLRKLHPDNPRLQQFTDEDRVVVSEPPANLPGARLEVPESTALIIQPGADEQRPFQPRWP